MTQTVTWHFGRNLQKCAIWYYLPVPTRSCHRASHINLACVQGVRHPRSKNVWERCAFTNYQTSPGYFRFQSLRTFVMISMTSLDWARRMMLSSPERMASHILHFIIEGICRMTGADLASVARCGIDDKGFIGSWVFHDLDIAFF